MQDSYNIATVSDFATVMRDFRVELGITQEELGIKIRKTRRWVSDVERGKTNPSLSAAMAVMRVLGYRMSFNKNVQEGEIDLIALVLGEG